MKMRNTELYFCRNERKIQKVWHGDSDSSARGLHKEVGGFCDTCSFLCGR